jgi:hypothetical protein
MKYFTDEGALIVGVGLIAGGFRGLGNRCERRK